MNTTLEASAARIDGKGSPIKVVFSLNPDRHVDELAAKPVGLIPYKHQEAEPEERPDWFAGQLKYADVQIPLPAYCGEHRFELVLSFRNHAAVDELRALLDTAEALVSERYPAREGGERA